MKIKLICITISVFFILFYAANNLEGIQIKYDWSQPVKIFTLSGHQDDVVRAIYSPDGSQIISLSRDQTARIWDADSGKELLVLTGHSGTVRSAIFLPDKTRILTFSDDHTIKIWDKETGKEINSITLLNAEKDIFSSDFNHNGSLLALGYKGKAAIFDTETGQQLVILSPLGHPGMRDAVLDIHFRPDGNRIVTATYSQEVAVWDVRTGTRILNLHEHGRGALTAAYSPQMTLFASGSRDKTVILWDARLGTVIKKLNIGGEVFSIAFSPDGSTLLVLERPLENQHSRATLWNLSTGKQIAELNNITRYYLRNNSFRPDGANFLIAAGNFVQVFKASSKYEITPEQTEDKNPIHLIDITSSLEQNRRKLKLIHTALTGANGKIRIQASCALAHSDTIIKEIIPILIDSLESNNNEIRLNTILTLADIGTSAIDAAESLFFLLQQDQDIKIRTAAIFAIGCISHDSGKSIAIRELTECLKDKNDQIRYHAAHTLDKMGTGAKAAVPALIETALYESSFGVRRQIAFNMGNAGETSIVAIPRLIETTSDTSDDIRWCTNYILWCITSGNGAAAASAIPALKKSMLDPKNIVNKKGGSIQKFAIHAIGGIGPVVKEIDPEIVTILQDLMENNDDYYIRKTSAIALQKILEVEGLRYKIRGYKKKTQKR
jgi:WD40 repeat protein